MNENLTLLSTDSSVPFIIVSYAVVMIIILIIMTIIIIRRIHKRQIMLEQEIAIMDNINRMSGNIIVISVLLVVWVLCLIFDIIILC